MIELEIEQGARRQPLAGAAERDARLSQRIEAIA
jgi:hypothetical protein